MVDPDIITNGINRRGKRNSTPLNSIKNALYLVLARFCSQNFQQTLHGKLRSLIISKIFDALKTPVTP